MRRLLAEIRRRDRLLYLTGSVHLALLPIMAAGALLDQRLILGQNAWIKPMKFALSNAIYVWTIAWLLAYVRERAPRAVRIISRGVAGSMLLEIACIAGQSARGVPSHFNATAGIDAGVFAVMGLGILVNTLLAIWLLKLFWLASNGLPRPHLWGIRLGLATFLLGSAVGAGMITNNAHTVGVPDGGPGLPFVGWSTVAGDLRPAHLLGLHALQLLPLLGWLVTRWCGRLAQDWQTALVLSLAAVYVLVSGVVLAQALRGHPLLPG